MKNIKRILALVIAATMLVAIAIIPASAEEIETIQPRAYYCTSCGSSSTSIRGYSLWGNWYNWKMDSCAHGLNGYDQVQRQDRTVYLTCNTCGRNVSSVQYQTRRICNGYNK